MRSSPPSIRLDNVSKTYPGQAEPALAPLSMTIEQGEFFSLLGPSGSGKTTLLRLLAGFETTDSGAIFVDGSDVTHTPPFRRDVNTVFQSYALFPHMTVAGNVTYPLRMRGVPRSEIPQRVADALRQVEMTDFADRLPHLLSGGQRQRVALARALVSRPKVLLLDEPLSALDLQLRQQMQVVLRELQRRLGLTFVFVTHDQGEALSMSDRVAVLDRGHVLQIGTPEEIYYRPTSRMVAGFIGRANLVACTVSDDGGALSARSDGFSVPVPGNTKRGPVTVAVRSESIHLLTEGEPPAGATTFPATVETVLFHGDTIEVVLRAGEMRLLCKAPAIQSRRLEPGGTVRAWVAPADVVLLNG